MATLVVQLIWLNYRNSFDTSHRRGSIKIRIVLPRVVPVETHWLGLAPICRPPKSATKSYRVAHRFRTVF